MSRGRVAICALIAMFAFAALAAPALAKKENVSYFEASGETKLAVTGGQQEILIPFEEHGSVKVKCGGVSGTKGEVKPTEGKTDSFTEKVKYEGCGIKGKKKTIVAVTMSDVEYEFHSNGTLSILNEVKIEWEPQCKIVMDPQTVGAEEVEEGKKGPVTYATLGSGTTREVEAKIKTHTHEAGETNGFEFEGEKQLCSEAGFKTEGGKYKGNMTFDATTGKESWIGFHEEILTVKE